MSKAAAGRYNKHISEQFNAELEDVRQRVLAMGGMVEQQVTMACKALFEGDAELAKKTIADDEKVNGMEVYIDEECSRILARRHPAASDLRLVTAVIKTITDLERIGDEAARVARMALDISEQDGPKAPQLEIENLSKLVVNMLQHVLDAFARMDAEAAVEAAKMDEKVDREYEAVLRQCITFMIEDPRSISRVLDLVWSIRSLERIGDHAKNISEYIIFFVHGKDVRHFTVEEIEKEVGGE